MSSEEMALAKPAAGMVQRQGFSESEMEQMGETASTALAARERAVIESRFIMALRRPRSWMNVRTELIQECRRPGVAGRDSDPKRGRFWYHVPRGNGIEGFSIRFAEAAIRAMGNVAVETATVYEDGEKRIVSVTVLELEKNISYPATVVVGKTIERNSLPKGETPLRVRSNSQGRTVYVLPATDDDVAQKQGVLVSKAIRNGALRLIPGDILAECEAEMLKVRLGELATQDPKAAARKVADGFMKLNVKPNDLAQLLGHEIDSCTPAEIADLRDLYKAIEEGRTTWFAVMSQALADRSEDGEGQERATATTGLAAVTAGLKAQAAGKAAADADRGSEPSAEEQEAIRQRELAEMRQAEGREPGSDDDDPAGDQKKLDQKPDPRAAFRGARK